MTMTKAIFSFSLPENVAVSKGAFEVREREKYHELLFDPYRRHHHILFQYQGVTHPQELIVVVGCEFVEEVVEACSIRLYRAL
jgi:hypothetical protein